MDSTFDITCLVCEPRFYSNNQVVPSCRSFSCSSYHHPGLSLPHQFLHVPIEDHLLPFPQSRLSLEPFQARPRRPSVSLSSPINNAHPTFPNLHLLFLRKVRRGRARLPPASFLRHPMFPFPRLVSNPPANTSTAPALRICICHLDHPRRCSQATKTSFTSCCDAHAFDPHPSRVHPRFHNCTFHDVHASFFSNNHVSSHPTFFIHVPASSSTVLAASTPQPSKTRRRCNLCNHPRVTIQMRMHSSLPNERPCCKTEFIRPPSRVVRHP